jgi:DNA-binding response OmpR family regulator
MTGQALVLVADDDEDILELVKIRLERAGYATVGAGDGDEALRLAVERRPDLCVLDLVMPKRTGLEVLTELRVREETASIPVILLTATAQERQEGALARAADAYLTKPFRPGELEQRVRALLDRG